MLRMLALLAAAGCTPCAPDGTRQEDGSCALIVEPIGDTDTAAIRGATRVKGRHVECLANEGWIALADAAPDVGGGTLDVAGSWDGVDRLETHPMTVWPDAPHWQLAANLGVAPPASQQAGVSTAFPCDVEAALTWRLWVWDAAGRWSDCRVWGADPVRFTDDRCTAG